MKTPGEQLFRIIKAMSPAEKRYFKRDRGNETGEIQNRTLRLFDLINEQQEYDEEAVKKGLSDDPSFVKNLKIHKNRLQQLVLKSLRSMHDEEDTPARLRSMLSDVDWLLKSRLNDLALQTIQKAKELCYKAEQYELLLVFLGIEARQALLGREHKPLQETPIEELLQCNAIIENYVLYAHINQSVLLHTYQVGYGVFANSRLEHAVRQLVERSILEPDLRPLSFPARRMHNHIFALWNLFKGDYRRSCEYTLASLEEFDAKPGLPGEHPFSYMACLINHILASFRAGQIDDTQSFLDKGFDFIGKHTFPSELFGYLYYAQLRLYVVQGQHQRAYDYAAVCAAKLQSVAGLQSVSEFHHYMSRLLWASVCLTLGKIEQAGELLRSYTHPKEDLPPGCLHVGQLLELIFHVEQGDGLLVENLTQTYLKRLQRHGGNQPFFKWFLSFLRKKLQLSSGDRPEWIRARMGELSRFKEDMVFDFLLEIFPLYRWLQARSQGVKLADLSSGSICSSCQDA